MLFRSARAFVIGSVLAVAGCSGGNNLAPVPQMQSISQGLGTLHKAASGSPACTPVRHHLVVSPTALALTSTSVPGQFTACTRHFSKYTVSATPSGIVSVPGSVAPKKLGALFYAATINVGAVAAGNATITVSDQWHRSASVSVTVTLAQSHLFIANSG